MPLYDSNPPVFYDSGVLWDAQVAEPVERKTMAKVSLRLDQKNLDQKLNLGDTLVTGVTGKPHFPNPAPPLADITANITSIRTKRAQRQALLDEAESIQVLIDQEEKELDRKLTRLGKSCESAVDGDPALLSEAGFPLQNGNGSIGALPAPGGFKVTIGRMEGECNGKCAPVKGARSYIAEAASAATGPWTQVYTGTRTRFTAKNLVSGQLYYFRMKAIGSSGDSEWSDIAHKRAA